MQRHMQQLLAREDAREEHATGARELNETAIGII